MSLLFGRIVHLTLASAMSPAAWVPGLHPSHHQPLLEAPRLESQGQNPDHE